ncbi:MAG TPA: hypothetical protein DCY93_04210, partial [Firmicutes bacterium]|nr:hypothetical protein [Bacillota bacterium]
KRTTGANDAFITVSDGTNTIDIYVSKRIATAARTAIDTELAKLAVGSTLTINGAFADYYKKPQIALTDASQIVVG